MSFPINDSLLNFEDCHYLNLDTVIVGTGRDRVKFLDLEGRWKRSGQSCAAVARVFNHIEKLNYATTPLTDLGECSLNAIRGPTPITTKGEWKPVSLPKTEPIQVLIEDEVPASPREIVPHRSAGYGAAHERRRLSIPNERSRSPSVSSRNASPVPPIYNSQVGKGKWSPNNNGRDIGYSSGPSSGAPSPRTYDDQEFNRQPHRTQILSPLPSPKKAYDSEYDSSYVEKASQEYTSYNELRVNLRETRMRRSAAGK